MAAQRGADDPDSILVPAIIEAEIAKAMLGERPTPALEMQAIAKAILAIRHTRSETIRAAYRQVLRKELRSR